MNDTMTVVRCCVADPRVIVECSPDEWVRGAARHLAAGVTLVRLDAVPAGSPWDDDPVGYDPATDQWEYPSWPGVAFVLPHD